MCGVRVTVTPLTAEKLLQSKWRQRLSTRVHPIPIEEMRAALRGTSTAGYTQKLGERDYGP